MATREPQVILRLSDDAEQGAPSRRADIGRFVVAALQFGLLLLVILAYEIEGRAFGTLATVAFVGFLIHHFLPQAYRLPFFVCLSLAGIILVLGLATAAWVFGIGLVLIALCHLPVTYSLRILLLLVFGACLAWMRSHVPPSIIPAEVWPTLGAMFMFRLIVYLYDLYHKAAPFSISRSLGYFFMLPNVCFPLFPIVDYKTYCTTHFNTRSLEIYHTGVQWIFRGVLQLLAYRIIYHYVLIHPLEVTDLFGVTRFALATFFLYLRVSGQFHIIIGLLHLFGFNLPETHHLYYLSSSFTDFWRRINIYWKDFITKIFFYPLHFRLRKWGPMRALAIATFGAFFATWLLHSYQSFWLLGTFELTWQDTFFWWSLAALVLANALYEARRGRPRSLAPRRRTVGGEARRVLCTLGTFTVICILWTVWSCESLNELSWLATTATRVTAEGIFVIAIGAFVLSVAAVLLGGSVAQRTDGPAPSNDNKNTWSSISTVAASCLLLLGAELPSFMTLSVRQSGVLNALTHERLNERDAELQRRGYYEMLTRAGSNTVPGQIGQLGEQVQSPEIRLKRYRSDLLYEELNPLLSLNLNNAILTTNRWGMRDRDYTKAKPPGTYRIAVIGSSHEMGDSINDTETFENVLEDRLNHEKQDGEKYEILNFSVGGHGVLQKVLQLELNAMEFQPDAVFFFTYSPELDRTIDRVAKGLRNDLAAPESYKRFLNELYKKAGVDRDTPGEVMHMRLRPYGPEIVQYALRRLAEVCRQRDIKAFVVYRPEVIDSPWDAQRKEQLIGFATEARLRVVDLSASFDEVADRQKLAVSATNLHCNPLAHRLLADELYRVLNGPEGELLRAQTVNRRRHSSSQHSDIGESTQ
jgi:hypothetical protein